MSLSSLSLAGQRDYITTKVSSRKPKTEIENGIIAFQANHEQRGAKIVRRE
jgi:hypothetical protein